MSSAQALWITAPTEVELREAANEAGPGDVEVQTLFSGISRGTERLVFRGEVPEDEYATMRAPYQEGEFSFPVKYGYAAVGWVVVGPRAGECVFALHPHQTRFTVPDAAAYAVPEGCPAERAILAANMETALTIMWDSGISCGDRVAVIGCGVVGALVAYLAAKVPGVEVTFVDVDPSRETIADTFGCRFSLPQDLRGEADVVIHASANAAGLETALGHAGLEARIVEASWYGTRRVDIPLGASFHRKRLQLVSSQVGRIPAGHMARWDFARRMNTALGLLADPTLDVLISGEAAFSELAAEYDQVLADPLTLCHRIRYGA